MNNVNEICCDELEVVVVYKLELETTLYKWTWSTETIDSVIHFLLFICADEDYSKRNYKLLMY